MLQPISAATFTVSNTNDAGPGSLRQAITNANTARGADNIVFKIPGAGQKTIRALTTLADITDSVVVDGGNRGVASNRVELTGGGVIGTGLSFAGAAHCEVRNLVINGFMFRQIQLGGATGAKVEGNYVGVNASGTAIVGGSGDGIDVYGSSDVTIGGTTALERNVISSSRGTVCFSTRAKSPCKVTFLV